MSYQAPKIEKVVKAADFVRESFYAGGESAN
jgi:hypothetical protein